MPLLNPHHHVRIWFSTNPDVFLNPENQLRMVKMCSDNPDDVVHFIYDASLLTEDAERALHRFCDQHKIVPLEVQSEIWARCQAPLEDEMFDLYQAELETMYPGGPGNPAVASDIVRWLRPVLSLGVYSDFDTDIKTKDLPEAVEVQSPFLMNIGAFAYKAYDGMYLNLLASNTDIVAVTEVSEAESFIHKIQVELVLRMKRQDIRLTLKNASEASRNMNEQAQGRFWMQTTYPEKNTAKILNVLKQITQANSELMTALDLRKQILSIEGPQDKKYVNNFKKNIMEFIKYTVILTSGPMAVQSALFKPMYLTHSTEEGWAEEFEAKVVPHALPFYETLQTGFQSENGMPIHTTVREYEAIRRARASDQFQGGDDSWLESGAQSIKKREEKMNKAAVVIQRQFRKIKEKTSENQEDEEKKPSPGSSN